jgi:hypothetical protein
MGGLTMGWTFYNSSGQKLSTAATSIDVLDISGATDIGADIADADLFIIDDNASGTNRKTAASRLKTYAGTTQAVQSDIEAETNQDTYIPPDLIKYSPGVAKGWCRITGAGAIEGSVSYPNSYNIASITDSGTGDHSVVWDVDFSQTNYTVVTSTAVAGDYNSSAGSFATGSVQIYKVTSSMGTAADLASAVVAYGDQ